MRHSRDGERIAGSAGRSLRPRKGPGCAAERSWRTGSGREEEVKWVGFRKLALPVTEIGAKPPSCAQRTSVLPGEMGVGIKHMRCNELTCQEVRLGEEIQISSLVKAAGRGDGKGTHRGKGQGRRLGSWGLSSEPTPRTTAWGTRKQVPAHSSIQAQAPSTSPPLQTPRNH